MRCICLLADFVRETNYVIGLGPYEFKVDLSILSKGLTPLDLSVVREFLALATNYPAEREAHQQNDRSSDDDVDLRHAFSLPLYAKVFRSRKATGEYRLSLRIGGAQSLFEIGNLSTQLRVPDD